MAEDFNKDRVTVLIDGNSVIYRAFYNVPPLTAGGVPTGVIHVFLSVLEKLRKNPEISDIIIIFDAKGKNRRHEMFESYKATRQAMPEDLILQLNILKEMLPYTGYPIYCIEGYEADDVINTLSQTINNKVWIVTKDKDLHQLVNDKVQIYDYQKDEIIDREKVYEKFGLYPESIPDMLALMGDTSDNIPGIAGIGPKTAKTLLDNYKSLDNIFNNVENLKGRIKEKIMQGKEHAYLSRELVKLFFIENMLPYHIERDEEKLKYYYELYQLKQQLSSLNTASSVKALEYKPVKSVEIMAYLNDKIYAVDETAYYEYEQGEPLYYYDIKSLIKKGINIPEKAFDILLADYLMDPDAGGIRQLKDESEGEFFAKLYKKRRDLFNKLKENSLDKLYYDMELPVARILAEMEQTGIMINAENIKSVAEKLKTFVDIEYDNIKDMAGQELNPNSPKQLSAYLYDKLGLKGIKKNKSGYSTDEDTLKDLRVTYPEYDNFISSILKYREINKLYSTYTLNMLEYAVDDRIHTEFKQTGTATGRLSSINPNMQNIPQKGEYAEILRSSFVAKQGCRLVSLDYSQIELRILAHLSQDENLIKAFNENKDIHTMTAHSIFHLSPNDVVTHDIRRIAKAVNFGILYGLSSFGLARDTKVTRKEAQRFIDGYFALYPKVKIFIDEIIKQTREKGYCSTILGRKRNIHDINSRNANIRTRAERMAVNAPIQGSAADIIKLAMINCDKYIKDNNIDAKCILQIHDELIFEVNENIISDFTHKMTNIMEKAVSLSVPLLVNAETGDNWGQL
ncbi:DNA polymerase [Mucispirillum schaedleri]|jgi:DNA polymerase-1|uniref:DNA polymerase I n=1 Tax=Mucispirillum schaedleri ASF457 TaxID=1379858 RepID=V2QFN0_9BACT|nr:DNA polymerase [Mucispirillum schaedleri]MCX4360334.1 DNA polymerase [Mucispirillum schaedleri]USF24501.1 DNA polymerase I, thermostable [Mucispirillum schaedleri ASF457]SIW07226.1 DNA polymerase [Mucispirillum schaedleri ASF457]